jgi:hypothetical protein
MKRRPRILAMLLAIATLAASAAEAAGAQWCDGMETIAAQSSAEHEHGAPADPTGDGQNPSSPSAAPCPMTAAASCAPAFLPVLSAARAIAASGRVLDAFEVETSDDALLTITLFRPPRI